MAHRRNLCKFVTRWNEWRMKECDCHKNMIVKEFIHFAPPSKNNNARTFIVHGTTRQSQGE